MAETEMHQENSSNSDAPVAPNPPKLKYPHIPVRKQKHLVSQIINI